MKELHATNSVQSNAEMFGEAETLNSLRHPCIIAFYGVVVNQVRLLIMTWLPPCRARVQPLHLGVSSLSEMIAKRLHYICVSIQIIVLKLQST